jgi:hypothetical protein
MKNTDERLRKLKRQIDNEHIQAVESRSRESSDFIKASLIEIENNLMKAFEYTYKAENRLGEAENEFIRGRDAYDHNRDKRGIKRKFKFIKR